MAFSLPSLTSVHQNVLLVTTHLFPVKTPPSFEENKLLKPCIFRVKASALPIDDCKHSKLSITRNMKPPAVLICFCCVVLGQEKAVPKSRYEEDIYVNNHTVSWLSEPLSTSYKFGQRFVKVAAVSLMFCLQTHVIRLLTRHEQSVLARDLFVCLRSANQNQ